MGDLLTTSVTGLVSYQRALDVTGHNIANVNTPGYSRQVAEFSSIAGQDSGSGFIGNGVEISTVKRVFDQLLGQQLQSSLSGQARLDMLGSLASEVDGLLASPDTGLSPGLQSFFNSMQDVVSDPSSLNARQVLLGAAQGLVDRLQGIDNSLGAIDSEVNGRLQQAVVDVNDLAGSIADLNQQIAVAQSRLGQPPNDLLDKRELLIGELAGKIGISTTRQDDGAINIFIGSGQSLVIGNQTLTLGVRGNEFDPTRLEVVLQGTGADVPLSGGLTGGEIGGILEFREQVLDPARQMLGDTAVALATEFNAQHAQGMDLNGNLGGDFFALMPPTVLPSSGNTGLGAPGVTVVDPGALAGNDYILQFDGASYSLRDAASGQLLTLTGSGTPADPLVGGGLSITTGGTPQAGDQFMIRPTRDAPASLGIAVSNARSIAIAAPTRTLTGSANIGDAVISQSLIVDSSDPGLLNSAVIQFTGPGTYSINGAGSFAYSSGAPIVINGSQFEISGTPETGDQFTLEANFGGFGDNRNGQNLSQIQTRGILQGGSVSITESYGSLIADVGSTTHQVLSNLDAQNAIVAHLQDSVSSRSGVNLDEEAARLVQFQQAYQAMAQAVAVASTLFDTLLGAVRR